MLAKGVNAVKFLLPARKFPIRAKLIGMKDGPSRNQLALLYRHFSVSEISIQIEHCPVPLIFGVKMWRIMFEPVHSDHNPQKHADCRHLVSFPTVGRGA